MKTLNVILDKIRRAFAKDLRRELDDDLARIKTELPAVLATNTECKVGNVKRAAILFHNPDYMDLRHLSGSQNDMDGWKSYLKTAKAGLWSEEEILPMTTMPGKELLDKISSMVFEKKLDYVFFAYSGHGFFNGTEDCICPGHRKCDVVSIEQIINALSNIAERGLLIIDACRDTSSKEISEIDNTSQLRENCVATSNPDSIRTQWDRLVLNAKKTFTVVCSCQRDSTASEGNVEGNLDYFGVFTKMIISAGQMADHLMFVDEACSVANDLMNKYVKWNDEQPQVGYCHPENSQIPFSLGC